MSKGDCCWSSAFPLRTLINLTKSSFISWCSVFSSSCMAATLARMDSARSIIEQSLWTSRRWKGSNWSTSKMLFNRCDIAHTSLVPNCAPATPSTVNDLDSALGLPLHWSCWDCLARPKRVRDVNRDKLRLSENQVYKNQTLFMNEDTSTTWIQWNSY